MKKRSAKPTSRKLTSIRPQIRHLTGRATNGKGIPGPNVVRPPEQRARRKFEHLSIHFPEGPIVNLRFQSEQPVTGAEAGGEEFYRLIEIEIGSEFLGFGTEAIQAIVEKLKPSCRVRHSLGKEY